MSDDAIRRYGFQQLDPIVCSKIIYFFCHFADNFEIWFKKLQLTINVQICGYFPLSISDKQNLVFLHVFFQIQGRIMFHKQTHLTFIIDGFHVDLRSDELIRIDNLLSLGFVFILPVLKYRKKSEFKKSEMKFVLTPTLTWVTIPQKLAFCSLILCVTIWNLYRQIGGGKNSASTLLLLRLTFVELKCSGIFQVSRSLKDQRRNERVSSPPSSWTSSFSTFSDSVMICLVEESTWRSSMMGTSPLYFSL